jgi:hypothetical protein
MQCSIAMKTSVSQLMAKPFATLLAQQDFRS